MDPTEMAGLYDRFRKPGYGTLGLDELVELDHLIGEVRPDSLLEIGTASGLSAGFFARMLDEHGGSRLTTVDVADVFYADQTKATGFLVDELYTGHRVQVERRTGQLSLDLAEEGARFDMVFIDAGHVHPWPLLDTLCTFSTLTGPRVMLHDDLNLFLNQRNGRSVGPKIVFDQVSDSRRHRLAANSGNIFRVDLREEDLLEIARQGLSMPWTLSHRIGADVVERLSAFLGARYGTEMRTCFDVAAAKFNVPNGRFFRGEASTTPVA